MGWYDLEQTFGPFIKKIFTLLLTPILCFIWVVVWFADFNDTADTLMGIIDDDPKSQRKVKKHFLKIKIIFKRKKRKYLKALSEFY